LEDALDRTDTSCGFHTAKENGAWLPAQWTLTIHAEVTRANPIRNPRAADPRYLSGLAGANCGTRENAARRGKGEGGPGFGPVVVVGTETVLEAVTGIGVAGTVATTALAVRDWAWIEDPPTIPRALRLAIEVSRGTS